MAIDFKKLLAKSGKAWKAAKARLGETGDFENLPDGKYIVQLIGAEVAKSSNGNLGIKWEYVVKDGEHAGQSIWNWSGLETEDNFLWASRDLMKLGKEVENLESPEEIVDILAELVEEKPTLRLKLTTKGEYQNKRIEKLVDAEDDDAVEAEQEAETEVEEEEEKPKGKAGKTGKAGKKEEEEEPEEEPEAEEEEPEAEEDEATVEVGSKVEFKLKGKTKIGTVKAIDEKKGTCSVAVGKEKFSVKAEALTLVTDEVDE